MTLRQVLKEIKNMREVFKKAKMTDEEWQQFLDQDIFININEDTNLSKLHLTAVCGSFLPLGLEAVLEEGARNE